MRRCAVACILAMMLVAVGARAGGQQAAPSIRVLSISAGPSGVDVNGTFALTSERSVFNRTDDKDVIVLFQWEGAPGPHRLLAQWRSPDGASTQNSAVDYVAKAQRFGAYWSLPLSATMTLGTWSVEASVDGLPAGRFVFEVTDNKIASLPVKPMLTQSELYDRVSRVFVLLHRSAAGRQLSPAAAFSPGKGLIYTSIAAIDGADDIRATMHDGTTSPSTGVVAWNRRDHWAVLSGAPHLDEVPIASPDSVKIGTRCASMDGTATGARVLSECSITGKSGASYLATFSVGAGVPGAPVVNEHGELIGLVGAGGPLDGAPDLRARSTMPGTLVVPAGAVNVGAGAPATLKDLRLRGATIPPAFGDDHVLSAGFARADAKGKMLSASSLDDMSSRDKTFAFFVMWNPKERLRGLMKVLIFDPDNRVVAESKPLKVDLRQGQVSTSQWGFTMLAPGGPYRADVLLDDTTLYRKSVTVTQ